MTPITDPNLVAQLEAAPASNQTGMTPVTDPSLIAKLEGGAAQTNPSLLPRIGADALAGFSQFGNGLINAPHNVANAINPSLGARIPTHLPNYNYGQALGVNAPNLGDKILQGATQFAPYMGLPGGAVAQGAAFGATQSQNPVSGAALGGTLGLASKAAPALITGGANLIGKATNAVRPQKFAEQLMGSLSGGNTLEGNAQSLAQDIRNSYQQQVANGQNQYKNIFNALGNNQIYNRMAPIFGTSQKGAYENMGNRARASYDGDLQDLHDNFISNPTLNNAHQLQSQLGANIGSMNYANAKGTLDQAGKNTLQTYQKARGSLLNDINSYLGSQGVDAISGYKSATNNWSQNVAPYLADSNLAQIAKGEITNPTYSQINSIFKNPEPEINKVVNDMGPQANDKIIFNELGKTQTKLTPEKLTTAFNQLDNKGLNSYVTPTLAQQFEQLAGKTTARNNTRIGMGALLGGHFGGTAGAAVGAVGAPILGRVAQMLPSINLPLKNALLAAAKAGYRPLVGAGSAQTVNKFGGQQ